MAEQAQDAVPMPLSRLLDEEASTRTQLAQTTASIDSVMETMRKQYVALARQRDEAERRLGRLQGNIASMRVVVDRVAFPPSLAPWEPQLAEAADDDEAREAMSFRRAGAAGLAAASQSREFETAFRKATANTPFLMVDQPSQQTAADAFVPYAAQDGVLRLRPALSDVAVMAHKSMGRVLVSRRPVATGSVVFCEVPFLAAADSVANANNDLPPVLRRVLRETLMSPGAQAAISAQKWDMRLAIAVLELLGALTREAMAAPLPDAHDREGDEFYGGGADSEDDAAAAAPPSTSTLRDRFFSSACPLQAMDAAMLNSLARYAQFFVAALPPCYQKPTNAGDLERAKNAWIRKGAGEVHHSTTSGAASTVKPAATDASELAVAPYDDNPIHQYASVSPAEGEAAKEPGLPEWCKVDADDVTRAFAIIRSNAITVRGPPPLRTASADSAPHAEPAVRRVMASITELLEHSCTPNCAVTLHHLAADAAIPTMGPADAVPLPARWSGQPLLELRALRPIAPGDRLSIAYVPLAAPRTQRAKRLHEQYAFDCLCEACYSHTAGAVDLARIAVLDADASCVVAPNVQSGKWEVVAAPGGDDRRPLPADDAVVLQLLAHEATAAEATASSSDTSASALVVREAEAVSRLLAGHDGVRLAVSHYAVHLRLLRAAALLLAVPMADAAAACAAVLGGFTEALDGWTALLQAVTGCDSQHTVLAVLAELAAALRNLLPAAARAESAQACNVTPSRISGARADARLAAFVVGHLTPLVDHLSAAVAVTVRAGAASSNDTAARCWTAIRNWYATASGGPHTAAAARAAILAMNPTADDALPPHLS